MKSKFFSIVIPIYNPSRLEKLLDSIQCGNDMSEIEVIIVNDFGSRDYESLLPKYDFDIITVNNEKNIGQGLSRQVGLDRATGKWVTFIDHDDQFTSQIFEKVKTDIENTGCKVIYSTRMIIANDYDFMSSGEYVVENLHSTLHGQFYNVEYLRSKNIRFNETYRAHEDTYFISLVNGHALLDESVNDNPIVESNFITYIWYLWEDSVTHQKIKYETNNISYLEDTLKEYLWVNFEVFNILYGEYEGKTVDGMFVYNRLVSLLMCVYWIQQYFFYIHSDGSYKKENLEYIKEARDKIMDALKIHDIEDLCGLLLDSPELYNESYRDILTNTDQCFIPKQTVMDFYRSL